MLLATSVAHVPHARLVANGNQVTERCQDKGDYQTFQAVLAEAVERTESRLLAYCSELLPCSGKEDVKPTITRLANRFSALTQH
jgi:hypothetical protein